jgi:hypothetical protein
MDEEDTKINEVLIKYFFLICWTVAEFEVKIKWGKI